MIDRRKIGKNNLRIGKRTEREVVEKLKAMGFEAYRTTASGAGKFKKEDVVMELNIPLELNSVCKSIKGDYKFKIEVKSKKLEAIYKLGEFLERNHNIVARFHNYVIFNIDDLHSSLRLYSIMDITPLFQQKGIKKLADTYLKKKKYNVDILVIKNNNRKKNYYLFIIPIDKFAHFANIVKCYLDIK